MRTTTKPTVKKRHTRFHTAALAVLFALLAILVSDPANHATAGQVPVVTAHSIPAEEAAFFRFVQAPFEIAP
jgi:hypothetical protein